MSDKNHLVGLLGQGNGNLDGYLAHFSQRRIQSAFAEMLLGD